jgi:hypothetical protein
LDVTRSSGGRLWDNLWKVTATLNLIVLGVAVIWFGSKHLSYDADIKASDLVVIVLAAVTVVLAALALVIGGLAVWGFAEIKRAAEEAARTASKEVAMEVGTAVARDVAAAVAAREAQDSIKSLQDSGLESNTGESCGELDPLTQALTS